MGLSELPGRSRSGKARVSEASRSGEPRRHLSRPTRWASETVQVPEQALAHLSSEALRASRSQRSAESAALIERSARVLLLSLSGC